MMFSDFVFQPKVPGAVYRKFRIFFSSSFDTTGAWTVADLPADVVSTLFTLSLAGLTTGASDLTVSVFGLTVSVTVTGTRRLSLPSLTPDFDRHDIKRSIGNRKKR
jgi:hypothetical protein